MTTTSFLPVVLLAFIALIGTAAWFGELTQLQSVSVVEKEIVSVTIQSKNITTDEKGNETNIIAWFPQQPDETIEAFIQYQIVMDSSISTFHPLSNCSATCQVKVVATNEQFWTLYTYDCRGDRKTIGGDEFYVTYHDGTQYATAAAIIRDNHDGSYVLSFVTPPLPPSGSPSAGRELHVYFWYTCGIGFMPEPLKDPWHGAGTSLGTYIVDINNPPPIRAFQQPVTTIDLLQYESIISFGDSLMQNLVMAFHPPDAFYKPNLKFIENPRRPMSVSTLPYLLDKLTEWHGKDLAATNVSTALLLGSSAWDVVAWHRGDEQGRLFDNHIQACRLLIEHVRANYPTVSIFWKLPSPVHVHKAISPHCLRMVDCRAQFKYWGQARFERLRTIQIKLMNELGVEMMDVFEAYWLSVDYHLLHDGLHYRPELNQHVFNWFYKSASE
jgi:hypothetical protein